MQLPSFRVRVAPTILTGRIRRSGRGLRRQFHVRSSCRQSAPGNGGRPPEDSTTDHNEGAETQSSGEVFGGRSKSSTTSSFRARQARRKLASALPPVEIPESFVKQNVLLYDPLSQPRLPKALQEDTKHDKISRIFLSQTYDARSEPIECFFSYVLNELVLRQGQLADDLKQCQSSEDKSRWQSPRTIAKAVRIWDMMIDAAWHYTDALYPPRQPEYAYKKRPFWWWHIHKRFDPQKNLIRDNFVDPFTSFDHVVLTEEDLDTSLSQALASLHVDTFMTLRNAVMLELFSKAPPNFDAKTGKRPLNILSLSGYGGKAIAQSVAANIANSGLDLIQLDAQNLSALVGSYIGQHWAYARGPVAMMGFRAAELNGKIAKEPLNRAFVPEDDDPESEAVQSVYLDAAGNFEDEMEKLKQGGYDCFGKWDVLKIDKILDEIIHLAIDKASESPRPVLIHLHDVAELSMTIAGSFILARLRALVDKAWQNGTPIAILGTSSSDKPSNEYLMAVRHLAFGEFVVSRHLELNPDEATKVSNKLQEESFMHLQRTDYVFENIENIKRMMAALQPRKETPVDWVNDAVIRFLHNDTHKSPNLRQGILPVTEVYYLAQALLTKGPTDQLDVVNAFNSRFMMGPIRTHLGQKYIEDIYGQTTAEGEAQRSNENGRPDILASEKLNEYEKRIATGLINKENLRVTFGDVHVPSETIKALKLLTSLALIRPDAFSYGVLATDKIPGCLLYGPPGTGKTMLAKAVAKESGANMLEVSGASINDKWVGESEKLIRALFTLAKKLSPCVVFIDEADALLANRSLFNSRASHREHINQFLREWDGIQETNAFIMVATNRPFDLDDAVLRRLPRKLLVDLPLRSDRSAILKLHLRGETLDETVSVEDLAGKTPYYSGSDLKNVCVAAAMAAVEEENQAALRHDGPEPYRYPERRTLRGEHFESALKQIPASISKDMASLKMVRKFDEEFGDRRRQAKKNLLGFGVVDEKKIATDANEARIRPEDTDK